MAPKIKKGLHAKKRKLRFAIEFALKLYNKKTKERKKPSEPKANTLNRLDETTKTKKKKKKNGRTGEEDGFSLTFGELAGEENVYELNYGDAVLGPIRTLTTTHRWTDSLVIVPHLMREAFSYPLLVWKVGILVLMNNPDVTPDLIKNFAHMIIQISRCYKREILLDLITYLLHIGDYNAARRSIEANIFRRSWKRQLPCVTAAYNGYRGMLEYISWANKRLLMEGSQGIAGNQQVVISMEAELDLHSQRAIDFFAETLQCEGNFDLFIQTHVILLQSTQRLDIADQTLKYYTKRNRTHPSPFDFYYEFLRDHSSTDTNLKIKLLKKLVRRNPSDSRLIDLINLMPMEAFADKVKLLVNALDHVDCRDDTRLWVTLAILLTNEAKSISAEKCYHRCFQSIWKDRKRWWPSYHFNPSKMNIDSTDSGERNVSKALVLATFCNTEHAFVVAVSNELKGKVVREESEKFSDTLEIVRTLNLKGCNESDECLKMMMEIKQLKKLKTKRKTGSKTKRAKGSKTKQLKGKKKKRLQKIKSKCFVSSSSSSELEVELHHNAVPSCSTSCTSTRLRPRTRTVSYKLYESSAPSSDGDRVQSNSRKLSELDDDDSKKILSCDSSFSIESISDEEAPPESCKANGKAGSKQTDSAGNVTAVQPWSNVGSNQRSDNRVCVRVNSDVVWVENELCSLTDVINFNKPVISSDADEQSSGSVT